MSICTPAPRKAFDLVIHATVDSCWHIYSQDNDPDNGPVPTYFEFEWPQGVTPQGAVEECTPLEEYDPNYMMDLKYFEEEVFWRQTVDLSGAQSGDTIGGYLVFMVCDASMCLPPEEIAIAIAATDIRPETDRPDYCPEPQHWCDHTGEDHGGGEHGEAGMFGDGGTASDGGEERPNEEGEEGLLWTFLLGFGLGLAALLTPCVFP